MYADVVWYGMVWYGMVWYGIVLYVLCVCKDVYVYVYILYGHECDTSST